MSTIQLSYTVPDAPHSHDLGLSDPRDVINSQVLIWTQRSAPLIELNPLLAVNHFLSFINMDLLDVLIAGHRRMEVAKYFVVASRTLLFYDIITNLDDEIRYIWSKPWSLVRFIYHVNRLWPVVLLGATTPAFFVPSPPAQICKAIVVAGSYGTALAIVCPGFVMTLRVWALYERQRMVLFWLLLGQTCMALPALIEIKIQADHNMYLGNLAPGVLTGCLVRLTSFAWVPYLFALIHESTIFGLTIWKTWRLNREFGSMALTTQLTLDGSLYYVGLLFLLLFCCWGVTVEVMKIGTSASGFVVAMNSIMCNRMIVSLHIFTEKIKEKDLKISIRTYHIV